MFEGRLNTLTSSSISSFRSWNLIAILGFTVISQVFTGYVLVIFYVSDLSVSFFSINYIISEISAWWIQAFCLNIISLCFIYVYIFLFWGLASKSPPLWNVESNSTILFFLLISNIFFGSISSWSHLPIWWAYFSWFLLNILSWVEGVSVVWVSLVVNSPTWSCFLIPHYLLPFISTVALILPVLFLYSGSEVNSEIDSSASSYTRIVLILMSAVLFTVLLWPWDNPACVILSTGGALGMGPPGGDPNIYGCWAWAFGSDEQPEEGGVLLPYNPNTAGIPVGSSSTPVSDTSLVICPIPGVGGGFVLPLSEPLPLFPGPYLSTALLSGDRWALFFHRITEGAYGSILLSGI